MRRDNLYEKFKINSDIGEEDLNRVYRNFVKKYHPDTSKDPKAESKLKKVNEIYEVLSDPVKRAAHDAHFAFDADNRYDYKVAMAKKAALKAEGKTATGTKTSVKTKSTTQAKIIEVNPSTIEYSYASEEHDALQQEILETELAALERKLALEDAQQRDELEAHIALVDAKIKKLIRARKAKAKKAKAAAEAGDADATTKTTTVAKKTKTTVAKATSTKAKASPKPKVTSDKTQTGEVAAIDKNATKSSATKTSKTKDNTTKAKDNTAKVKTTAKSTKSKKATEAKTDTTKSSVADTVPKSVDAPIFVEQEVVYSSMAPDTHLMGMSDIADASFSKIIDYSIEPLQLKLAASAQEGHLLDAPNKAQGHIASLPAPKRKVRLSKASVFSGVYVCKAAVQQAVTALAPNAEVSDSHYNAANAAVQAAGIYQSIPQDIYDTVTATVDAVQPNHAEILTVELAQAEETLVGELSQQKEEAVLTKAKITEFKQPVSPKAVKPQATKKSGGGSGRFKVASIVLLVVSFFVLAYGALSTVAIMQDNADFMGGAFRFLFSRQETNPTTFTVEFVVSDSTRGIVVSGATQNVEAGRNSDMVSVQSRQGYVFYQWCDGVKYANRQALNVTQDTTLTAYFVPNDGSYVPGTQTVKVIFEAVQNGSIVGERVQNVVRGQSTTAVTAVPYAGFQFINWTRNGSVIGLTFDIDNNAIVVPVASDSLYTEKVILANFQPIPPPVPLTHTLRFTANYANRGTFSNVDANGELQVVDGTTSVQVVALANLPYFKFSHWEWSGSPSSDPRFAYTPTSTDGQQLTLEIIAVFVPFDEEVIPYEPEPHTMIFTPNVANRGTIYGVDASGELTVLNGEANTLVLAVAANGYQFVRWEWAGGYDTNAQFVSSITNIVPQRKYVTAVFQPIPAPQTFAVTFIVREQVGNNLVVYNQAGSLSGGNLSQTVAIGTHTEFVAAIVGNGFAWVGWQINGTIQSTALSFRAENVMQNLEIIAVFVRISHTAMFIADNGGSVLGTASQQVLHGGDSVSVTATPNMGYRFVRWEWAGGTSNNPILTLSNVTQDVVVTAIFQRYYVTVTFTTTVGGAIASGVAVQTVARGASTSQVTAVALAGYSFAGWSNGAQTLAITVDIASNHVGFEKIITAIFTEIPPPLPVFTLTFLLQLREGYSDTNNVNVGSLAGTVPQTIAYGNSSDSVTALAANGFVFLGWWRDNNLAVYSTQPTIRLTNLTADTQLRAVFEEVVVTTFVTISLTGGIGEIASVKLGDTSIDWYTTPLVLGVTIVVTLTPPESDLYYFAGWQGDMQTFNGIPNPYSRTFVVTPNLVINASFNRYVNITVQVNAHGMLDEDIALSAFDTVGTLENAGGTYATASLRNGVLTLPWLLAAHNALGADEGNAFAHWAIRWGDNQYEIIVNEAELDALFVMVAALSNQSGFEFLGISNQSFTIRAVYIQGNGTNAVPFRVTCYETLLMVNRYPNREFALVNDLDLQDVGAFNGLNLANTSINSFSPLAPNGFSGAFAGASFLEAAGTSDWQGVGSLNMAMYVKSNNPMISNLIINQGVKSAYDTYDVGLFARLESGARLAAITLQDFEVSISDIYCADVTVMVGVLVGVAGEGFVFANIVQDACIRINVPNTTYAGVITGESDIAILPQLLPTVDPTNFGRNDVTGVIGYYIAGILQLQTFVGLYTVAPLVWTADNIMGNRFTGSLVALA